MRYLKGTADWGIRFVQRSELLHGSAAWPPDNELPEDWPREGHREMAAYTDSNWGPQDASKPLDPDVETRMVAIHEAKSVQGYVVARCGGPVM